MIVLDTNVLSPLIGSPLSPDAERISSWMNPIPRSRLYTTVITEAEIRFGIALLDDGRRKRAMQEQADHVFDVEFDGHVLPLDRGAASAFAEIAARRRRAGRPIASADAQIAAVALARGMAVATRNVTDFADCGIDVINPWTA